MPETCPDIDYLAVLQRPHGMTEEEAIRQPPAGEELPGVDNTVDYGEILRTPGMTETSWLAGRAERVRQAALAAAEAQRAENAAVMARDNEPPSRAAVIAAGVITTGMLIGFVMSLAKK